MRDWRFDLQRFSAAERTLPPTPRRRQKAREKGDVARSPELGGAVGLVAAAVVLHGTLPAALRTLGTWSVTTWSQPPAAALDVQGAMAVLSGAARAFALVTGPVLVAAAAAAAAAGVVQTGLIFSPGNLAPQLDRINPASGLGRIFSRQAPIEFAKAAIKAGGIVLVGYGPCRALLDQLVSGALGPVQGWSLASGTAVTVLLRSAVVLGIAGAVDYAFRRSQFEASLRMSHEELRQETRESEGDPQMRLRRRRRMREMSRRRMLLDVRKADVVLANPTHYAVALRYDPASMAAPKVVAKGADFMAERIKALARRASVPVVDNPPLARSLYGAVKVGQTIPAALYRAVAEVLAFVWRVRGRTGPAQGL